MRLIVSFPWGDPVVPIGATGRPALPGCARPRPDRTFPGTVPAPPWRQRVPSIKSKSRCDRIHHFGRTVFFWSTNALTRQCSHSKLMMRGIPCEYRKIATVASGSKIGSPFDPAMRSRCVMYDFVSSRLKACVLARSVSAAAIAATAAVSAAVPVPAAPPERSAAASR
jgi:hypothetical protein